MRGSVGGHYVALCPHYLSMSHDRAPIHVQTSAAPQHVFSPLSKDPMGSEGWSTGNESPFSTLVTLWQGRFSAAK